MRPQPALVSQLHRGGKVFLTVSCRPVTPVSWVGLGCGSQVGSPRQLLRHGHSCVGLGAHTAGLWAVGGHGWCSALVYFTLRIAAVDRYRAAEDRSGLVEFVGGLQHSRARLSTVSYISSRPHNPLHCDHLRFRAPHARVVLYCSTFAAQVAVN